ncbi:MAG: putative Ig domain-containing protein, partial [Leptospiraceae bacterium]|nr:putative Ig domain-containing protein [Leptospiraceae bacterium]
CFLPQQPMHELRAQSGSLKLVDEYGRDATGLLLPLIDWDGQIANPVVRVDLVIASPSDLPGYVRLRTRHDRMYFENAGGYEGGELVGNYTSVPRGTQKFSLYVAIYPDRDGRSEAQPIPVTVEFMNNDGDTITQSLQFIEIDQDQNSAPEFEFDTDFSQDDSGFFRDRNRRELVEQAAADWAYFIADMQLDTVGANQEHTWLMKPDFGDNVGIRNSRSYRDFKLYFTGVNNNQQYDNPARARTSSTNHTAGGRTLRITRSGAVAFKTSGIPGLDQEWFFSNDINNWHSANDGRLDFYSTALHEIGHAIGFSGGNSAFDSFQKQERISDRAITDYQKETVVVKSDAHLRNVDRYSRWPGYGYEAGGEMPAGPARGLITRLDLLLLKAIGFELRDTSAFARLQIKSTTATAGRTGQSYLFVPEVYGGVPGFRWSLTAGQLPSGLKLDPASGAIHGRPLTGGTVRLGLRVQDATGAGATQTIALSISGAEVQPENIDTDDTPPDVTINNTSDFKRGDTVLAIWPDNEYWYAARIRRISGKRVTVDYYDGDEATLDLDTQIRPFNWRPGTQLWCEWSGDGYYYEVTIERIEGRTMHVVYEDGDEEDRDLSDCLHED